MSRLKYALIGCGRRGRAHMETVLRMRDTYEVVAVCDTHAPSANRFAEEFSISAYQDVRELVAREQPDVCDVVVPAELHHVVSCYLSQHRVHHNVETPLSTTLGLMDMMIEAAANNQVKLQTSENLPFIPVEQFVSELIRSGAIGPVHKCYRLFSTTAYHGLASIRVRINARPLAVSGIDHDMPVVPHTDHLGRYWETEKLEFHAVDFDNGALGIAMAGMPFVGSNSDRLGRNTLVGFETCGERGTIVTNGNQGAIGGETVNVCTDEDIDQRTAVARSYPFQREAAEDGITRRIWVDLPEELGGTVEWVNPYFELKVPEAYVSLATMLDGIARAVRNDSEVLWPGANGRQDVEMALASARSAKTDRRPVPLPLSTDPEEEEIFDRDFIARFSVNPREDIEQALGVSFKAR